MSETFAELLGQYRRRNGLSRNHMAHLVGVDPSYATRCELGQRDPPRCHIVDALALTLRLDPLEWDAFRLAAGYSPRSVNGSGWSPSLHAVATVLNDHTLDEESRAAFEDVILQIARRWKE